MTDDDRSLGQIIEQAVNDAIEKIVQEHEHGFVLKWVGIVETVGEDGTRGVWTMTSDNVKAWDTLGLLEYGKQLQNAQFIADRLDPE